MKYRNFTTTGEARDQEWIINNQEMIEGHIHDEMRAKGFLPVVDGDVGVKWWFKKDSETFGFKMTVKGLKVSKKQARDLYAILDSQDLAVTVDGGAIPLAEVINA